MKKKWGRMLSAMTWWHKVLVILIAVAGAAVALDNYYAHEADLAALAGDIRQERIETRYDRLSAEYARLRSVPTVEKRPLTSYEQERLEQVKRELERLRHDLQRYEKQ